MAKIIAKSTFMKKNSVEAIRDKIGVIGTCPASFPLFEEATTKTQLTDMYYKLKYPEEHADTGTEEVQRDIVQQVFTAGVLFKLIPRCWWGKSTKCREGEVGADEEIITGTKVLVDPDSLKPLRSVKSMGERAIKRFAYKFLDMDGMYYIPKEFITMANDRLKEVQEVFFQRRAEYIEEYDDHKAFWAKKSGKYYDEDLYPSKEALKNRFVFRWLKFQMTVPDADLGVLTEQEHREEVNKQRTELSEFFDGTLIELAGEFTNIISKLQSRVKKGETIRPKTIESIERFCQTFDGMNVTGNTELRALVQKVQKTVTGTDTKDFKKDKFRNKVNKQMAEVLKSIETSQDERLSRALDF